MKKYLSGIFAIVLAIGFCAFTPAANHSVANTQNLYWFLYDDATGLGAQLDPNPISKDQAEDLSCPDMAGVSCARGYTSATNPGQGTNQAVEFIRKPE